MVTAIGTPMVPENKMMSGVTWNSKPLAGKLCDFGPINFGKTFISVQIKSSIRGDSMSERTQNIGSKSNHDQKIDPKSKPIALDRVFPSVWVLGITVLLVSLLTVVTGWKVIHLEQERNLLKQQRLLLEKDQEDFKKYMFELPKLRDQHQQLTKMVAHLEGTVAAKQAAMETLSSKAAAVKETLDTANAERTQAESAKKNTAKLCAKIAGKALNLSPLASIAGRGRKNPSKAKKIAENPSEKRKGLYQFCAPPSKTARKSRR